MANAELTGPQKAAILFLHMNEETAAEVFKGLTRREIKALNAATKEAATLASDSVETTLRAFLEEMGMSSQELVTGPALLNRLAVQRLGTAKAREFLGDDSSGLNDTLGEMDSRTIGGLIKKEHPQTVALILAHLPPIRAAEVLAMMPEAGHADVLCRLAKLDQVTPDVVALVDDALNREMANMGKAVSRKVGGINLVADIMNNFDKSREQKLMTELEEADQGLADEVRGLMFVFDDLINLDQKGTQVLLKEVERDTLVLALKAADEDLKQHIFKNLSSRAVEMIMDDMEQRGPVRLSEVEKAQADVVKVALTLVAAGTIELSKGEEGAMV